ncbi:MAG: hypothetical protein SFW67_35245 [Myxococcaceae bacterium]|nr:hypothetical protein [Myxococcaceae bacterium]
MLTLVVSLCLAAEPVAAPPPGVTVDDVITPSTATSQARRDDADGSIGDGPEQPRAPQTPDAPSAVEPALPGSAVAEPARPTATPNQTPDPRKVDAPSRSASGTEGLAQTPPPPAPVDAATRLSGALGLGTFGSAESVAVQSAFGAFMPIVTRTLVPFVGARYWTPFGGPVVRRVGVELAGGFSVGGASTDVVGNGMAVIQQAPTIRAFAVHGALPIALVSTPHFLGHLAPEVRHLVVEPNTTPSSPLVPTTPGPAQRPIGSSVTDLSVRVAGELFFGFIQVPRLSLEFSLRLGARLIATRQLDGTGSGVLTNSFTFQVPLPTDLLSFLTSTVALKYYL